MGCHKDTLKLQEIMRILRVRSCDVFLPIALAIDVRIELRILGIVSVQAMAVFPFVGHPVPIAVS